MEYDPTPELLKLIDQQPRLPYAVTIDTRVGVDRRKVGSIGLVARADGSVQLRIQKSADTEQDRLDYLYEFQTNSLVAADRLAHEYLRRSIVPTATWDRKLADILGTSRDPILLVLDRNFARSQMKIAAKQGSWTRSKTSDGFVYRNSLGRFFTADSSGRLTGISIGSGSRLVQYSYNWKVKTPWISPLLASDSISVSSFVQKRPLPASDTPTEETVRQMLRAHQRFANGTIENDNVQILLRRPAIGESTSSGGWIFDGTRLSIKDAKGKYRFQRTMRRDDVLPSLAKFDVTVNPYSRNLLARQIPFRDFFLGLTRMRTLGKIGSGNQAMSIVQATGPGRKLTLTIGSDFLVRETEYVLETARGPITSDLKYRYSKSAPSMNR